MKCDLGPESGKLCRKAQPHHLVTTAAELPQLVPTHLETKETSYSPQVTEEAKQTSEAS